MFGTCLGTGKSNFLCYQFRCPSIGFYENKPTLLWRTAATKPRVHDTSQLDVSSSLAHNADTWEQNVRPGSSWRQNTVESRRTAFGKTGAYLSKAIDERNHLGAIVSIVADDDVLSKDEKEHATGYINFPGSTLSPLRRPPGGTCAFNPEATDGGAMQDIEGPQVQKRSFPEEAQSKESADRNLFGTKLPEDDAWGAGKGLPRSDPLFRFLRRPRRVIRAPMSEPSENISIEEGQPTEGTEEKRKGQGFYEMMRAASVEEIERKLVQIARYKPNVNRVQFLLKELIEVRHVEPRARHYEALILANCEDRHGSADALYLILAEMERENIGIGSSTLSALLKVLSIHPDAQLLPRILQAFASQWSVPSSLDTTYLILTLIRLNQFEIALDHLEHLIAVSPAADNHLRSPIPKFLYMTMLYRLALPPVSDHTATLHLLYLLNDNNLPISNVGISSLLDAAAEALHLDLTLYIWRSHVDTHYMIPSTGLCRNVLLTASRHGNSELSAKAGKVLDLRGIAAMSADGGGPGLIELEMEMIREAFAKDRILPFGADDEMVKQAMYRIAEKGGPLSKQEIRSKTQGRSRKARHDR
jgi:hypothetical protein